MEEIKSALTPEELAQKANELEEELTRPLTEEERRLQAESEKESSFIHFFIPRKGFIATPVLIDINILVFILMDSYRSGNSGTFHTGLAELGRRLRSAHPDR